MIAFRCKLTMILLGTLSACSEPIIVAPDAVFPDGSRYEGELESGMLHGKGTLIYPNKTHYTGDFVEGQFHGTGELVYATGEKYTGEYKHGQLNGFGHFVDTKENSYEGEFKQGVFNGHGTHSLKNGAVYTGQFDNGLYHGKGRYSHDDYFYEGDFVKGVFTGSGSYKDYEGSTYSGQVKDWVAHGKGSKTNTEGTVVNGDFENGYASGDGKIDYKDGSQYEGSLSYDKPEGEGVMTYANGDVFKGEFSYGRRFGKGTLTRSSPAEGEIKTLSGKWKGDSLIHNFETGDRQHDQAGIALEYHQENLKKSIDKLEPSTPGSPNIYFLGVAGDGSQSVFKRELEYVAPLIESRYSSKDRSMLLVNHHDTAEVYPLATKRSIESAVNGIAAKMDTDEDVLVAYFTSHGSKDHEFYLNHDSIKLSDLGAKQLAEIVKNSRIKWKVIIVSACYSGGFISELKDDYTMIITAADADSRSFGCSEESEMTYFGRALFKEALTKNPNASLKQAFAKAKELVSVWEKDEEKRSSNPLIHAPAAIVRKLEHIRAHTKK
ncbi:C13 family peptidase [Arenicella sp. 4NH20-0111]|uniref:C13 family peptidase n=1 Tax=Arenicella sp. 4NH20-0111 TaxID=3127648 RepID=UPI00334065A9